MLKDYKIIEPGTSVMVRGEVECVILNETDHNIEVTYSVAVRDKDNYPTVISDLRLDQIVSTELLSAFSDDDLINELKSRKKIFDPSKIDLSHPY